METAYISKSNLSGSEGGAAMAREFVLVSIDGTGPADPDQYYVEFHNSFLRQIDRNLGPIKSRYFPGPRVDGQNLGSIVETVFNTVKSYNKYFPNMTIYLAGYSRGGAGVMEVAKKCASFSSRSRGIPIKAMFLLDPVSKWDGCPGGFAGNVEKAYVMFRDQKTLHYDAQIAADDQTAWIDKFAIETVFNYTDPDRYARVFMGNASTSLLNGNTTTQIFKDGSGVIQGASHGAMGGLPWTERRADEAAVNAVAKTLNSWILPYLRVQVVDKSYTANAKAKSKSDDELWALIQARKKVTDEKNFQRTLDQSRRPDPGKI